MNSLRWPFTVSVRRRIAAVIAALCVVSTQLEVSLPDAHDGDATASHMAGAGTHEEPSRAPTETPASHSTHAVHVDHCAHAHVFASCAPLEATRMLASNSDAPATATPLLASVTAAPHSRPPIA